MSAEVAVDIKPRSAGFKGKPKGDRPAGKGGFNKENKRDDRPQFPDEAKYNAEIEEINKTIDTMREKMKKLTEKINGRTQGKEEFQKKKDEMREIMDKFTKQIEKYETERKNIMDAMQNKTEQSKKLKLEASNMKKTIGYDSEKAIDDRIAEIDRLMQTTHMPLSEEKKLIAEISTLKKNKRQVGKIATLSEAAGSFDDVAIGPLKERLAKVKADLDEAYAGRKAQNEQLKKLTADRHASMGDVKDIIDEKEALGEGIKEHIRNINKLRDELREKRNEWMASQAEARAAKREKIAAEKRAREIEYKRYQITKELEKEEDLPLSYEIQLVEQAMTYMKNVMKRASKEDEQEEKKEAVDLDAAKPKEAKGMVLLPKNQRQEVFYFAPKKGKKAPALAGEKKEASAAPSFTGDKKKIVHDMGTLRQFAELQLDAPMSADDCPGLLEKLTKKLEAYKADQKVRTADTTARKAELKLQLASLDAQEKMVGAVTGDKSPKKGGVKDEEEEGN